MPKSSPTPASTPKVPQETWDGVVAGLIAHARRDRLADGFVEAIGAVGALLAEHFP